MNVKLYKAWINFVKNKLGSSKLQEYFVKISNHKRKHVCINIGKHTYTTYLHSKKFWLLASIIYATDARYLMLFIFTYWRRIWRFCDVFPEASIYMDLNNLNEKIMINKIRRMYPMNVGVRSEYSLVDNDVKYIAKLIANEAEQRVK